MLAPRQLPEAYKEWNRTHNAPYGRDIRGERFIRQLLPPKYAAKVFGEFSIQPNNDTRRFEYPWAIDVADLKPGMNVLDLGGGLAGFQFELSKLGMSVTNVDPGSEAKGVGWPCSQESIDLLNQSFNTSVRLINSTLTETKLAADSFDRVFSISVLEHFSEEEFDSTITEIIRILKPGGRIILTTDLFLDLSPFTSRQHNDWGTNFPVGKLLDEPAFETIIGDRSELFGCAEFDHEKIQSELARFLIGGFYPVLVQCLVLQKK